MYASYSSTPPELPTPIGSHSSRRTSRIESWIASARDWRLVFSPEFINLTLNSHRSPIVRSLCVTASSDMSTFTFTPSQLFNVRQVLLSPREQFQFDQTIRRHGPS